MKKDNFEPIRAIKEEEDIFEKLGISCWNAHDDMSEFESK